MEADGTNVRRVTTLPEKAEFDYAPRFSPDGRRLVFARYRSEEVPEGEARRALLRAILDELARLKASRAGGSRGGVPIVPEYIPGKILGPSYTTGQVVRLACRRVTERELSGDFDEGEIEEMVEGWTEGMRALYERVGKGDLWDRTE